jgi:glycosyltransferase involved in cell wall biosynthesis
MRNVIKVSVIVPVYNRERYIGRCIRSLMNQSIERQFYEIIIINDGSKDSTEKILNSYAEEIRIFKHSVNKGLTKTLNLGISKAKGKFFVRVDSDDYVNKDFLLILYLYLNHNPNFDAVACDYITVDDNENFLKRLNCLKDPVGCGIMFRKNQLKKLGLYNRKFLKDEDKELRKRFDEIHNVERISLPLYRYRRHKKSITKGI